MSGDLDDVFTRVRGGCAEPGHDGLIEGPVAGDPNEGCVTRLKIPLPDLFHCIIINRWYNGKRYRDIQTGGVGCNGWLICWQIYY